jgi:hypothetical protein
VLAARGASRGGRARHRLLRGCAAAAARPGAEAQFVRLFRAGLDEPFVTTTSVLVNRAPVLTLWAAIVAERLGFDRATALTLGKAVAGLNAQSKGRRLGIFEAPAPEPGSHKATTPARRAATAPRAVLLLGRAVPVIETPDGLRAKVKDQAENPGGVERYLTQKFGPALSEVEAAMRQLARAYPPKRLGAVAFALYEQFRPEIPEGVKGWGAKGRLELAKVRAAAGSA